MCETRLEPFARSSGQSPWPKVRLVFLDQRHRKEQSTFADLVVPVHIVAKDKSLLAIFKCALYSFV